MFWKLHYGLTLAHGHFISANTGNLLIAAAMGLALLGYAITLVRDDSDEDLRRSA